nr:MAG TPA: hypothetical protein [Caudoviricetes sp.]
MRGRIGNDFVRLFFYYVTDISVIRSKGIMWIDESEPSYEHVGACPGLFRMVRFAMTIR